MSESDILKNCTELQAGRVRQLIKEGWEAERLDGTEVRLKKSGYNKWVKEDGNTYP